MSVRVNAGQRPSRAVHITTVHPAGDNRIARKECQGLADSGFDVWLLATGAPPPELELQYVPLEWKPGGRSARFVRGSWAAFRAARRLRGDVYHLHDPELIPLGLLLRLTTRSVVIYDAHEDLPAQVRDKTWIPGPLRVLAVAIARGLELLANATMSLVVAAEPSIRLKYPSDSVLTVQNFPRMEDFEFVPTEGRPRDRFAYVGGLSAERGIPELVEAVGLLPFEATLVLAGTFHPPSLLEELQKTPAWDRVEYLGQLPGAEIGAVLAGCTAGMVTLRPLANYLESQPTKMYEYLASGMPVICSNFPLWQEVIDRHKCGLAVDPTDPKAIMEAMRLLSEDRSLADRMSRAGRQAVEDCYRWENEQRVLVEGYRRLLQHRHSRWTA